MGYPCSLTLTGINSIKPLIYLYFFCTMITSAKALDNLLVRDKVKNRGILIELSAPASVGGGKFLENVLRNFEDALRPQMGEIVTMDFVDGNHNSFSNDNSCAESMIFENLGLIWGSKKQIIESLENGINVVVIKYTFDLLLHAKANNCFGIRNKRDPIAASTVASLFCGLPVPDITISYNDDPPNMDRWYKKKLKKIFDKVGSMPSKEDEDNLFSTKLFKREEARAYFDHVLDYVRSLQTDVHAVKALTGSCILSRYMQNKNDLIKFY